jgi:hypothetical protein
MLSLLNPTLWLVALAILAGSSGLSYFKGRTNGMQVCEARHAAATVLANDEARKLEQARQRRADEAAKLAAAREARIRAAAAGARRDADSLRGTVSAVQRHSEESRAAADNAVRALADVFGSCVREYQGLAEEADRATSEVKTLRDAWPK